MNFFCSCKGRGSELLLRDPTPTACHIRGDLETRQRPCFVPSVPRGLTGIPLNKQQHGCDQLAPMAEALPVTSVLRGVDEIATIGQDARKISYQAAKFTDKLLSLKAPLTAIQECSDLCPVEVLVNTNEMLGESKAFLEEYSKSSRETRTAQRRQYAKAFANLFARAEDSLEALNLVVRTAEGMVGIERRW